MKQQARAHVVIHGRVQGVFFRMNTARAAKRYGVMGWVRNRRDGTVEAFFEGSKKQVDAILQWCRKGDPPADVSNVDVNWEEAKGEFSTFDITY